MMPFYQYFCEHNQLTVEVEHGMTTRLRTWGEVCETANLAPGETPVSAPVIRLISCPMPIVWRVKGLDKDEPSNRLEL